MFSNPTLNYPKLISLCLLYTAWPTLKSFTIRADSFILLCWQVSVKCTYWHPQKWKWTVPWTVTQSGLVHLRNSAFVILFVYIKKADYLDMLFIYIFSHHTGVDQKLKIQETRIMEMVPWIPSSLKEIHQDQK